jgi:AraC-like DNA-binding protein
MLHGQEFEVQSGQVIFIEKGVVHGGTKISKNAFFWLHFMCEVLSFETEQLAREHCINNEKWIFLPQCFSVKDIDRLTVMLGEINHYRFEVEKSLVRDYLTAAFIAELSFQYGESFSAYSEDKRFSEILGYVNLNISKNFSVSELAERFSYNTKYLSSLFKKFTGKTPVAYVMERKIEFAKRLLVSGNETVKAIAKEIGFDDEYYFMKVFKRYTNMTPKNFRNTFCACRYT